MGLLSQDKCCAHNRVAGLRRSTLTCYVSAHLWQQCLVSCEQQVQPTGLVIYVYGRDVGQEVIASLQ